MAREPKFQQTYVMVSDIDRSTAFYAETLGLGIDDRGERSTTFSAGEGELKLEQDFDEETLSAFGLDDPGDERGSGLIIGIEVGELTETYERCTEADCEILTEPREVSWGRELFLVRDPDGYVIEVSRPI